MTEEIDYAVRLLGPPALVALGLIAMGICWRMIRAVRAPKDYTARDARRHGYPSDGDR